MELHDRHRRPPELHPLSNGHRASTDLNKESKRPRLYLEESVFSSASLLQNCSDYTNGAAAIFDRTGSLSDPFALRNLIEFLDSGKYGSVTDEIESLCARRDNMLKLLCVNYPSCLDQVNFYPRRHHDTEDLDSAYARSSSVGEGSNVNHDNVPIIDLESDDGVGKMRGRPTSPSSTPCMPNQCEGDSLETGSLQKLEMKYRMSSSENWNSSYLYRKVVLGDKSPVLESEIVDQKLDAVNFRKKDLKCFESGKQKKKKSGVKKAQESVVKDKLVKDEDALKDLIQEEDKRWFDSGKQKKKKSGGDKGEENVVKNDLVKDELLKDDNALKELIPNDLDLIEEKCMIDSDEDGLLDMWKEMSFELERSKDVDLDNSITIQNTESEYAECQHSYVLKDDLGYVCQLCGVIQKSIETIIDYQWKKESKSMRTYPSEARSGKTSDEIDKSSFSVIGDVTHDFAFEVSIHPRHDNQMKPHQREGFRFLVKNLVAESPGGCILAHAPGSGKTFLIISFIQSFLAKFPLAKPLVVLPKGILSTWKGEFKRWQVEDFPLFDLYLASNRAQQLEVLNNWVEKKSVLFLGYKQFSSILCETPTNNVEAECQDKLLKVPSLLILDEGHTPRNENTNMLYTLSKVHTPRKVVLSGTIFQNHVKEVFNILNLVRPKFLKTEDSRTIVRRILSKVEVSGGNRKFTKLTTDSAFFDMVEETLQRNGDFKRKAAVISDLREMTCNVLHYYKGDFLDELPGLVDFTVVLKLTDKQENLIEDLAKLDKFKRIAVGSAIYMHPELKEISEKPTGEKGAFQLIEDKIDQMIGRINFEEGVKTRFVLKLLKLAESAKEKVLVFSQYLLPIKFLERILATSRGWTLGREMFIITGDTGSEDREAFREKFNESSDARVLFGSIKACGEGISLVGASRVIILDVHLNPSVTRQAISRAFRPGQRKKVYTYRLVAADSPEEQDHQTSFCKDLISKLWFEWSDFGGMHDFTMDAVETDTCGDMFIETPNIQKDIKVLYRR